VGAIISEPAASIQGGLGGAIVNFNQYYSIEPQELWATNLIAALLGIFFFVAVVVAERLIVGRAPEHIARASSSSTTWRRSSRGNTVALQGIDLTIESGEFVSLIGPSGCGKSTLLRTIGDLVQPTSGTIVVNGKSAHQDADIVVFDPNKQVTLSAKTHHSKVDYNLFEGTTVTGTPDLVLLRGRVLVENDELVVAPGSGSSFRARFGEELKPARLAVAS
jgi:ABC transporter